MRTLSLFRHAKSAWDDPRCQDFDRPLSGRGLQAAARMGAYMEAHGIKPDLVVSSPSARTKATCDLAFAKLAINPPVRFEKALYLASPATILSLVKKLPENVRHVMIVGHNPGLHDLAVLLLESGPDDALARLREKLPTGSLVEMSFSAAAWKDVRQGSGTLVRFVTPRSLDG